MTTSTGTLRAPRESDLARARDGEAEAVAVDDVGGGVIELTLEAPHVAAAARPGEFVQLRVAPGAIPLLRRPMSVAWVESTRIAVVFAAVGEGTRRLAGLRRGDTIRVLGPLGLGFSPPPAGRTVVCVAGGLGCAPFPLLARRALEGGVPRVVVLSGAATAERLYPAERYLRGDSRVTVVEATDDGSRGYPGVVTDLVAEHVAGVGALYACGPNPMLAALAGVLSGLSGGPAVSEVSLEAPMGCGFGTCLGCALPVGDSAPGGVAWALCCRQGPVMPATDVDWEALRALPAAHVA